MRFWNKAEDTADIFIYGDITAEKVNDSDTTAKSFLEDLKSFGGQEVKVHINSGGGDCFAALAIHNVMKEYGAVDVAIEGICASAASIIACGGRKISMAANSLLMIHNPSVGLEGFFTEQDVDKLKASLEKVKGTLIETYRVRTGKTAEELSELLTAETWFTAEEAIESGFADEIIGQVEGEFDAEQKVLFMNKMSVDCRKYDCEQVKARVKLVDVTAKAREMERVSRLKALKDKNKSVNAVIDVAIAEGRSVDEVIPYVEALKKVRAEKMSDKILALIEDNMNSGAEGLRGSARVDERASRAALIAKYANGGR